MDEECEICGGPIDGLATVGGTGDAPTPCECPPPPGPGGCTTVENCTDSEGNPVPLEVTLTGFDPDGDGILNVEIDGDLVVAKFATFQGEICTEAGRVTIVYCIDGGDTSYVGYVGTDGALVEGDAPTDIVPCTDAVDTALDCAVGTGDPCAEETETPECFVATHDECVAEKLDTLIEVLGGDCANGGDPDVCNCEVIYVEYDPDVHEPGLVVGTGSEEAPFQVPIVVPGSDCCVYQFDASYSPVDGETPSGSGTPADPFLLPLPAGLDVVVNDGPVGQSRPYAGEILLHDDNVGSEDEFEIEHPTDDIDTAPKVYKRDDGQLIVPGNPPAQVLCDPLTVEACVPGDGLLDDAELAAATPGGCCPSPGSTYLELTSDNGTVNQPFTPLPQTISTTVVGDMVFIGLHVAFSAEGGVNFQPSQLSITNLTGATDLSLLSDEGGWNVQGQTWDGTHQVLYAANVAGGGGPVSFDFEYSGPETTGVMAVTVDGAVGCDVSSLTGSDYVHQPPGAISLGNPIPADPYTTPDGAAVVQYQSTTNNMGGGVSVTDHGTIHAVGFAGGDCQYYTGTGRHSDWRNGDWFQVTDPDGLTWTEQQDWASDDRPGACQLAVASGFLIDDDFVGGDGDPIMLACDPVTVTNLNDCDQTLTCNYSRDFDWTLVAGCVLEVTPIVDGVPQTPIMLTGAGSGTESYTFSQSAALASGATATCSLAFRIEQLAWINDPTNSLIPGECCVEGSLA